MGFIACESLDAATWVAVLMLASNIVNLSLDTALSEGYKSPSQVARVLTEDWVQSNIYCPECCLPLSAYENNRPVADFFCSRCSNQFELKSKSSPSLGKKIVDGAYETMMKRIKSDSNPHFLFLSYDKSQWKVSNLCIIPKYYFTPEIIIKRKPLAQSAKRAGWTGCNIDISSVPSYGKIFYVRDALVIPKEKVLQKWKKTHFLSTKEPSAKGWLLDIMRCLDEIPKNQFTLDDIYPFEAKLSVKYPNNRFIKEKIRQQLQILRDKGMLIFVRRGVYQKV